MVQQLPGQQTEKPGLLLSAIELKLIKPEQALIMPSSVQVANFCAWFNLPVQTDHQREMQGLSATSATRN